MVAASAISDWAANQRFRVALYIDIYIFVIKKVEDYIIPKALAGGGRHWSATSPTTLDDSSYF